MSVCPDKSNVTRFGTPGTSYFGLLASAHVLLLFYVYTRFMRTLRVQQYVPQVVIKYGSQMREQIIGQVAITRTWTIPASHSRDE